MKRFGASSIFLLLWLIFVLGSFVAFSVTEPTGDGFSRGWNRISTFLIWQVCAVSAAVGAFALSFGLPKGKRRLARTPLALHGVFVVGLVLLVLYLRFSKPEPEPYQPPVFATAPESVVSEVEKTAKAAPDLRTFQGIYRSGFEASFFYTMEGEGPWWLLAEGEPWDRLQENYVEAPGRGGGVTVALSLTGWTDEEVDGLEHLGVTDKRIHVENIENLRPLTREEFDRVLQTIRPQ